MLRLLYCIGVVLGTPLLLLAILLGLDALFKREDD